MRKLIAIFCGVAAACAVLAGCDGSAALRSELVGTWDCDDATIASFASTDLDAAQLEAAHRLMFLSLDEDGAATFVSLGEAQAGTWEVDGGEIAIAIGGSSVAAEYADGALSIEAGGQTIPFSKAESAREAPSTAERDAALKTLAGLDVASSDGSVGEAGSTGAGLPAVSADRELADLDEPIVVADDEVAAVTVAAVGTNALGDPGYLLHVANNSENAMYLIPSGFTVSGANAVAYGTTFLAPGETADTFLAFDAADLGGASTESLADVQGALSFYSEATGAQLASYWLAM